MRSRNAVLAALRCVVVDVDIQLAYSLLDRFEFVFEVEFVLVYHVAAAAVYES